VAQQLVEDMISYSHLLLDMGSHFMGDTSYNDIAGWYDSYLRENPIKAYEGGCEAFPTSSIFQISQPGKPIRCLAYV